MMDDPAQMSSNAPIGAIFFKIIEHDRLFPIRHKMAILCVPLDTPLLLYFGPFFSGVPN